MTVSKTSVVIGGLSGIGQVITETLRQRGDTCFTCSRRESVDPFHISHDLLSRETLAIDKTIDAIVFCQRERDPKLSQNALMVDATIRFLESNWHILNAHSSIVFLGSVAGANVTIEQDSFYHATRDAIESLARYYAVKNPIPYCRVNCVIPTTIIKPENKIYFDNLSTQRSLIERITPLKRMGTASDIANAVEFFTSDKSSFISGQSLVIDGGASALSPESIGKKSKN